MKKKEWVYREILYQRFEKGKDFLRQKKVAERCGISAGMVSKALEPLDRMNAIEKKPMGFRVIDARKLLLYWASLRRLERDILFSTRSGKSVHDIEKEMPKAMFTAYSAYRFRFGSIPSEYSEVMVYADPERVRERFGESSGVPDIIVLRPDPHLEKLKEAPLAQVFVDLWNAGKWYAEDFLRELEKKMEVA